jgi:glycosyltransferase involved in cell wall biosynthesis
LENRAQALRSIPYEATEAQAKDAEKSNLRLLKFPKISLIIPVFQEEKILEETLKCYPKDLLERFNTEIIISDGGSTDRTIEIAKNYANKIVIHQESRKQTISEGRNMGAEAATGDIFVFINGDTVPKDVEYFLGFIRNWFIGNDKLSYCGALACPVTIEPEKIMIKDKIFYNTHNTYVKLLNTVGVGMGRGECQIIKSDVFRKVGGYNSTIAAGEDFDLYRRISKVNKVGFADNIWVYESPRRFRRYGYLKIIWQWLFNALAVMVTGKSVSDEWEAVR